MSNLYIDRYAFTNGTFQARYDPSTGEVELGFGDEYAFELSALGELLAFLFSRGLLLVSIQCLSSEGSGTGETPGG